MPQPSPDFDLITLKWAGTYLDGAPAKGSLQLAYGGGVMLDDDPVTPINIFPKQIIAPLTTLSVMIDGEMKEVGYAEFKVPAPNDPDITGGGGTYTLTESLLDVSTGRTVSFPVDVNAPDGIIWLNKIIPTTPTPGAPISVVYWDDFQTLTNRVSALEAGGGGGTGGPAAWADITGKPATFAPTTGTTASTAAAGNDTRLSDARVPVTHTHSISDVTDLQAALDAASGGGGAPAWENVTGKPATFTPSAHGHAASEITGLATVATTGTYSDLTGAPIIPSTAADIGAQPAGNYVDTTDTRLTDARTPTAHNHTVANVTGLQAALDGKQPSGTYATAAALTSGLSGKADTTHAHVIADTTGLQAALDAKGTSNLAIGTSSGTAKVGNWLPAISDVAGLTQALADKADAGALYIDGIINEGDTPPAPGIYIVRPV